MKTMMNLTLVYRFQSTFFIAGTFSCPTVKKDDVLSLQMKRASYEDKIFIKSKQGADQLTHQYRLKEFFPIKTYFEYEGFEVEEETIKQIKEVLGGAEAIWVNFQDSTV
jgi:hypothetical protein